MGNPRLYVLYDILLGSGNVEHMSPNSQKRAHFTHVIKVTISHHSHLKAI